MRHSSPILPGMRELEEDPSLRPPWMKRCQLLHHLWMLVGHRGFPGSIECCMICKDAILLYALNYAQSEC